MRRRSPARIGLATGVLLLPEHNPVLVAKQAATLDVLSAGRFSLGVGVGDGWSAEEFAALGVPFAGRGRRTEEYLAAMRALWAEDPASFTGEFTRFDAIRVNPKPLCGGRLPVVVGGNSDAALRRAVTLADGWYGFNVPAADVPARVAVLADECARHGRAFDELTVAVALSDGIPEHLPALGAAGVTELVIVGAPPPAPDAAATWVAELTTAGSTASSPTWVESMGGPLIAVPVSALARWRGCTESGMVVGGGDVRDDYDRACEVEGLAGVISIGEEGAQGLVLADEPASSCYLPELQAFVRWLGADCEGDLIAAAEAVLADPTTEWEESGVWETDGPAVLMDSVTAGAELGVEYPAGGGMPEQPRVRAWRQPHRHGRLLLLAPCGPRTNSSPTPRALGPRRAGTDLRARRTPLTADR